MFFESWAGPARTAVVGVLAYFSLVLMLRISGKRTLAKMNSFDLIVTVALGSSLATILLSKQVPLAEGLTAFALLILLQLAVTWLSVRSKTVRGIVHSEPRLVFYRGDSLDSAMRSERITHSEVLQAIRSAGLLSLDQIEGVVMETDGTMAIVQSSEAVDRSSLADVVKPQALW